jgi:hypothetical protein
MHADKTAVLIGLCTSSQVTFYPGRYAKEKGSILPVGDPTQYIPAGEVHCPCMNDGCSVHCTAV